MAEGRHFDADMRSSFCEAPAFCDRNEGRQLGELGSAHSILSMGITVRRVLAN
jgi:hypothetical protein